MNRKQNSLYLDARSKSSLPLPNLDYFSVPSIFLMVFFRSLYTTNLVIRSLCYRNLAESEKDLLASTTMDVNKDLNDQLIIIVSVSKEMRRNLLLIFFVWIKFVKWTFTIIRQLQSNIFQSKETTDYLSSK